MSDKQLERKHFHFERLIACDNGNIFYSTEATLDFKITETLRVEAEIQTHSKSVIEHG